MAASKLVGSSFVASLSGDSSLDSSFLAVSSWQGSASALSVVMSSFSFTSFSAVSHFSVWSDSEILASSTCSSLTSASDNSTLSHSFSSVLLLSVTSVAGLSCSISSALSIILSLSSVFAAISDSFSD